MSVQTGFRTNFETAINQGSYSSLAVTGVKSKLVDWEIGRHDPKKTTKRVSLVNAIFMKMCQFE